MELIRSRRSPKVRERVGTRRVAALVAGAPLLSCLALARPTAVRVQEAGCPAPDRTPLAGVIAPDSSERSSAYWIRGSGLARSNLGTGFLDIAERADGGPPGSHDWLPRITLPLYFRPGDERVGVWIHRGWWLPPGFRDDRIALTYRGMVETEYESARMIVTGARDDGWLEVWVDIGPSERRGAATWGLMWTHRCLLDLGEIALEYVPWSQRFLGPGAPALSFRDGARHALREAAGIDAGLVTWLSPRDEVELLEIAGDWARVRATRPGVYATECDGEAWDGETFVGWVRWRDDERGTWLWYPTRGC